ncbi:MAG: C25 family cysteine peptidase, partial [candidate division Zixibacteria bacterium]|nr:C25 family cysteine peptidase [candidate division Zixibacteria bacterium]
MIRFLYKTLFLLVLCFPLFSSVQSTVSNINILSSSDSEFHFQVKIDPDRLIKYVTADSSAVYVEAIKVGIPAGARVDLTLAEGSSFTPRKKAGTDTERLSAGQSLVRVSEPITLRGRQMVTVEVYPVLLDGYYESVEIRLEFSGGLATGGRVLDDPHFDNIFQSVVANYAEFRNWLVPARPLAKSAVAQPGPFAVTPVWYRISVNKTGLTRVTGGQLEAAGLTLGSLPSENIHMFYGGGLPLPAANEIERPAFEELPIIVEDGGDGTFGSGDYILFYGEHVDRWLHQPADTFVNHAYSDRNVYWLAVSDNFPGPGLRMDQRGVQPDGVYDSLVVSFRRRIHVEQDNTLRRFNSGGIIDYYTWFWSSEASLAFFVSTPGAISGDTAVVSLNGRTGPNGYPDGFMNLAVNDIPGLNKSCNDKNCNYRTTALLNGLNEVELELWGSSTVQPYFDNIDIEYGSYTQPAAGRLDLVVGAFDGEARISVLDGFTGTPRLFDITDPASPVELTGYTRSNTLDFEIPLTPLGVSRFFISTLDAAYAPLSVEEAVPRDLYEGVGQTDMIIVTDDVYLPVLDEYVSYREAAGYSIQIFTVEQIMDNFSWGVYDPLAIRDFLKYAYENYPEPAPFAVLLVGDGSFDFLDILDTGTRNYVPPFVHPVDPVQTSSDDNYVYFGRYGILDGDSTYFTPDRGYDMMIARWPVASVSQAHTVIDKIKRYESSETFDAWRTRISLVADDEFGTHSTETFHVTDTEDLDRSHIPGYFNREKIYLWEYPRINNRKPDVNDAIVDDINKGTLLVNFVGHGNPDVWAHERVFTRQSDLPRLNNYARLPLFYAASCAIGFFDDPKREGMSEDLLVRPEGGAIATIAATRQVFASPNHSLNVDVFDKMLYNDSLTMCQALYAAKLERQYGGTSPVPNQNDRNFLYFGDPLMRLGLPRHDIEFTETPSTLTALAPAVVTGRIVDPFGATIIKDGTLTINALDTDRNKVYRLVDDDGELVDSVAYKVTGPTIYRGTATVTGGTFSFSFIPPLDIGYGGRGAKISLYADLEDTDAAGIADSIEVADTIAVYADSA